jgi:hypothetical protein
MKKSRAVHLLIGRGYEKSRVHFGGSTLLLLSIDCSHRGYRRCEGYRFATRIRGLLDLPFQNRDVWRATAHFAKNRFVPVASAIARIEAIRIRLRCERRVGQGWCLFGCTFLFDSDVPFVCLLEIVQWGCAADSVGTLCVNCDRRALWHSTLRCPVNSMATWLR